MGGLVVCVSGDVGEIIGVSVCVRVLFAKEGGCQFRECSASLDTMGGLVWVRDGGGGGHGRGGGGGGVA